MSVRKKTQSSLRSLRTLPLLPQALAYQRLGVCAIPAKFRQKKPAVRGGWSRFQVEQPDEHQLRDWFGDTDNGQLGIAVVCGQVSGGLLVRDFDTQPPTPPGNALIPAWKRSNPRLARSLPTVETDRAKLCRHLKAIESVAAMSVDELMPILEQWHTAALPVIQTKDFADTANAFCRGWTRVKTPAGGEGSIRRAYEAAVSSPLPPEAGQFFASNMRLLVGLCRELQRQRNSKPFYLASRDVADLFGFTGEGAPTKAWRMLERLCHAKILVKVRSGSQVDRRANEYRWIASSMTTPTNKETS